MFTTEQQFAYSTLSSKTMDKSLRTNDRPHWLHLNKPITASKLQKTNVMRGLWLYSCEECLNCLKL